MGTLIIPKTLFMKKALNLMLFNNLAENYFTFTALHSAEKFSKEQQFLGLDLTFFPLSQLCESVPVYVRMEEKLTECQKCLKFYENVPVTKVGTTV